jgi:hypothetical protein
MPGTDFSGTTLSSEYPSTHKDQEALFLDWPLTARLLLNFRFWLGRP